MIKVMPYKDINQVMRGVRTQIIDSVPYCYERFRGFSTPDQMFGYLKSITTFVKDPTGRELLQTAQTLFENNKHGIPGAGDCDCFTILVTSCLIVNEFSPDWICLSGNSTNVPSHIYNLVKYDGKIKAADLTEPFYGMERPYRYRQNLPLKFS